MANDLPAFTPVIQSLLEKHGSSMLPLTAAEFAPIAEARHLQDTPADVLFPRARNPQASVSGLLLLLNQWGASHQISQEIETVEGCYWHAIAHRMEPDAFNAAYWFRRVGDHPIFPDLQRQASVILAESSYPQWQLKHHWDPSLFIEWCDQARQRPGGRSEHIALAIQKAEWQLLFQWCSQAAQ